MEFEVRSQTPNIGNWRLEIENLLATVVDCGRSWRTVAGKIFYRGATAKPISISFSGANDQPSNQSKNLGHWTSDFGRAVCLQVVDFPPLEADFENHPTLQPADLPRVGISKSSISRYLTAFPSRKNLVFPSLRKNRGIFEFGIRNAECGILRMTNEINPLLTPPPQNSISCRPLRLDVID
jgi:hypothetical protein